jgi:hypothetical protein
MNGAEALAEARRTYDAQLARTPEIDAVAAQQAVLLTWLQEGGLRRVLEQSKKGSTQ